MSIGVKVKIKGQYHPRLPHCPPWRCDAIRSRCARLPRRQGYVSGPGVPGRRLARRPPCCLRRAVGTTRTWWVAWSPVSPAETPGSQGGAWRDDAPAACDGRWARNAPGGWRGPPSAPPRPRGPRAAPGATTPLLPATRGGHDAHLVGGVVPRQPRRDPGVPGRRLARRRPCCLRRAVGTTRTWWVAWSPVSPAETPGSQGGAWRDDAPAACDARWARRAPGGWRGPPSAPPRPRGPRAAPGATTPLLPATGGGHDAHLVGGVVPRQPRRDPGVPGRRLARRRPCCLRRAVGTTRTWWVAWSHVSPAETPGSQGGAWHDDAPAVCDGRWARRAPGGWRHPPSAPLRPRGPRAAPGATTPLLPATGGGHDAHLVGGVVPRQPRRDPGVPGRRLARRRPCCLRRAVGTTRTWWVAWSPVSPAETPGSQGGAWRDDAPAACDGRWARRAPGGWRGPPSAPPRPRGPRAAPGATTPLLPATGGGHDAHLVGGVVPRQPRRDPGVPGRRLARRRPCCLRRAVGTTRTWWVAWSPVSPAETPGSQGGAWRDDAPAACDGRWARRAPGGWRGPPSAPPRPRGPRAAPGATTPLLPATGGGHDAHLVGGVVPRQPRRDPGVPGRRLARRRPCCLRRAVGTTRTWWVAWSPVSPAETPGSQGGAWRDDAPAVCDGRPAETPGSQGGAWRDDAPAACDGRWARRAPGGWRGPTSAPPRPRGPRAAPGATTPLLSATGGGHDAHLVGGVVPRQPR
ncbi:collagen alpha-1(I) chain-like [Bacillus rossius redtenbacheri]|uniref:collagen alpha-1(I) chain-like n=1 Tax=Bacillus rossius redtenbacheri TaxID=93214 RepID=UPI002FDD1940